MTLLRELRRITERFQDSLFWMPAAAIVGALLAGGLTDAVDGLIPREGVVWLLAFTPSAGQSLLELAAGTAATVLGLGTSALIITVQLASSQYSPRLVRTFMRERVNRAAIASLLAVAAYALVGLAAIDGEVPEGAPAESLSATVTLLGMVIAVVLLVAMIDSVARSMEASSVIRRVLDEVRASIDELEPELPERLSIPDDAEAPDGEPLVVTAPQDAWLVDIDRAALLRAVPPGSCVVAALATGRFAIRGYPLAQVFLDDEPDEQREDDVAQRVRAAFTFGHGRRGRQDVEFGLRKFNDVALRALSPAVHDPGTAYEAFASLGAVVAQLLRTELPPPNRVDEEGRRLLEPFATNHEEFVHLAYEQIRQMAAQHPAMSVALLSSLRRIRTVLEREGFDERALLLSRQNRLLVELFENQDHVETDVDRVREAAGQAESSEDPREADEEHGDEDKGEKAEHADVGEH